MFTATSVYFLLLFLILWCYCGYLLLILIIASLSPEEDKGEDTVGESLSVALIVPFYNEEALVRKKVENLKSIEYDPEKMKVYFVDGCSTDHSCGELEVLIRDLPNWFLLRSGCKGKIHQVNYGLSLIQGSADVIACTDMDAMLSPDTVKKIVAEFQSEEQCAVVGANIVPQNTIPIEERYWQDQNLLRILESRFHTSSIVVAPCYAFRSSLMRQLPEDCIADDIYVAFKANTDGFRTRYIENITGIELRAPRSGIEFFRHKFRKGNAFLIELFRFLYRLPYMTTCWKVIYVTKLLQLAVIPWALPFFLLSTISMLLSGGGMFQAAFFGAVFILFSFLITSMVLHHNRSQVLRTSQKRRGGLLVPFIVSNLIMIVVGLSFPFYRQNSRYQKIGCRDESGEAEGSLHTRDEEAREKALRSSTVKSDG